MTASEIYHQGPVIKGFPEYSLIKVGMIQVDVQLGLAMLVKLFFFINNEKTADLWCGMAKWLKDAYNLHLCQLLIEGSCW